MAYFHLDNARSNVRIIFFFTSPLPLATPPAGGHTQRDADGGPDGVLEHGLCHQKVTVCAPPGMYVQLSQ